MRALTYNIRSGTDLLNRARLAHQAAVMRDTAADLVLLQEVASRGQAERLASVTGLQHVAFGGARQTDAGEFGNAMLSRWRLYDVENRLVPRSWPMSQSRAILAASLTVDGQRIVAVASHFGLLPREPEAAAEAILGIAVAQDGPLIVGGDLNRPLRASTC